jgi:hypothetical protein
VLLERSAEPMFAAHSSRWSATGCSVPVPDPARERDPSVV